MLIPFAGEAALAGSELPPRWSGRQRHDQDQCARHQGCISVKAHCIFAITMTRLTKAKSCPLTMTYVISIMVAYIDRWYLNTKTTIRTSTLNSSDMTRTYDIKVAYRPNHTYACWFVLLIMWSTFSGTRHCLMSSPTFSSVSYPTEYSKPLPTTPSQTTSYIFPTFPTTFLLYSNDNKANEWLCRKWKDSYHLFTVMNKYWLGWINSCHLLACPRKYVGRPWKEERTKTLLNHHGKQDTNEASLQLQQQLFTLWQIWYRVITRVRLRKFL